MGCVWTAKENKVFEVTLTMVDQNCPDRWLKIANAVGGKTVEDIKKHYDDLVEDIEDIEAGRIPLPEYDDIGTINNGFDHQDIDQEQKKLKDLSIQ